MRSELKRHQRGLTLIEVLVALAVLATAIGAILVLMGNQSRGAAALADNALARIVAENAMVEVVTGESEQEEPQGTQEIAGRTFAWQAARVASPIPETQLLTVEVTRDRGGQVLATLSTLKAVDQ
ncbi:type II secretion system minor pseudopilin GspI [Parvularcula dongshanensis]|uniref:Type II secretion system protein I n=1 Tax=Parvularcula dongshanensis TaxID=1173995 RepID=A0A840I0I3_9PROT|nr:general secretion pathway protein I [Parvularcula dongshanensis]